MELINLGTGSKGNCYILKFECGNILLDAGVSLEKIIKNINLNDIDFAFISHEHLDHSRYAHNLAVRGVEILQGGIIQEFHKNAFKTQKNAKYTAFTFPVEHNGCKNSGLVLKTDKECILFITDFSICKFDLSCFVFTSVIVECNYYEPMMYQALKGKNNKKFRNQVKAHMGLEGLKVFLDSLNLKKCECIYLAHNSIGVGNPIIAASVIRDRYKVKVGSLVNEGGINFYE